jgi:serpin B
MAGPRVEGMGRANAARRAAMKSVQWVRLGLVGAMSALCALANGCGSGSGAVKTQVTAVAPTAMAAAPNADVSAVVAGNNAFAVALAAQQPQGNLICSPYSVSSALAMTLDGARGETATQLQTALDYPWQGSRLNTVFNTLDADLSARTAAAGVTPGAFSLHLANATWLEQNYTFLPAFVSDLQGYFGAPAQEMDFIGATEAARQTINAWAATQTQQHIQNLIPPNGIDSNTAFVLTNAIYFHALWASAFKVAATANAPFTLIDGTQVSVPMMNQTGSFGYAAGSGWQALEMPYQGKQIVCDMVLPASGGFTAFQSGLSAQQLTTILGSLQTQPVIVSAPRFTITTTPPVDLKNTLIALGATDAFIPGSADFSGIDGKQDLCIGHVFHAGYVQVDEAGTTAAAATAVTGEATAVPIENVFNANQPFLFLIRDLPTGQILFWGWVMNPLG